MPKESPALNYGNKYTEKEAKETPALHYGNKCIEKDANGNVQQLWWDKMKIDLGVFPELSHLRFQFNQDTSEQHGLSSKFSLAKVDAKQVALKQTLAIHLLEHGSDVVDRDSWETQPKDPIELGNIKGKATLLRHLSKENWCNIQVT